MTEEELAAVIAAATVLLRQPPATSADDAGAPAAWRIAARIETHDAAHARLAARATSVWSMHGRLRG